MKRRFHRSPRLSDSCPGQQGRHAQEAARAVVVVYRQARIGQARLDTTLVQSHQSAAAAAVSFRLVP